MPDAILLIAQSARMLAVSAGRGGWLPLVLDRFADLDTRKSAHAWRKVPLNQHDFQSTALLALAQALVRQYSPMGWVYGSGLEGLPETVEVIAGVCPLLGNHADVVKLCANPEQFFAELERLQIPYPEITWRQPEDMAGWLAKQGGGHGGAKVAYSPEALGEGKVYFQKRLPGSVFTYSFLAGSRQLYWGAFNRLYQADYNALQPFGYAGAMNRAMLPAGVENKVAEYACRMIEAWNLRGTHGLDFMVTDTGPKVLELNPRPGAVVGLWDEDWPRGLLTAHVKACRGEAPDLPKPGPVRGLRVVFSRESLVIPNHLVWPPWCVDLPGGGEKIGPGDPICSVTAKGPAVERVERQLRLRKKWVERYLPLAGTADR